MTTQLPDARDKIAITARKAFLQRLMTPPLLFVTVGILLLITVGLIGSAYWFQNTPSGPELSTTVAIESTGPTHEPTNQQPTEVVTKEVTSEPLTESTKEPLPVVTVEQTSEPTIQSAVEPTQELTLQPTLELTIEPLLEPSTETAISPITTTTIDTATLPGRIAVPVFNNQTITYDLYISSTPNWQPQLFQKAASQPAFSPDGIQIVFRSWGGPSTSYSEQLIIRLIVGTTERFITNHPEDAHPHWGNFDYPIVFHTRPSGGSPLVCLQALWDSAPQDPQSRLELAVGENPSWLLDGRIVYFSGEPSGRGLYVMNKDGNGKRLIWPSSDVAASEADPKNNRVVFSKGDELYLLNIPDEGQTEPELLLNAPNERERLPVWSPDGQYIAYVKDYADAKWAVYVMRADGTGQTKLFDLPGSVDGKPSNVPAGRAFGWYEEQLAWGQ